MPAKPQLLDRTAKVQLELNEIETIVLNSTFMLWYTRLTGDVLTHAFINQTLADKLADGAVTIDDIRSLRDKFDAWCTHVVDREKTNAPK